MIKSVLMSLNVIAVLWLLLWSTGVPQGSNKRRIQQVNELCRSGVINTNAMHAQFHTESSSSEYSLAMRFSDHKFYFLVFIWPAAVLIILNTVVIEIFFTRKGYRPN